MYRITPELADKLRGKVYHKEAEFNPIQDINGDWFISSEEVENCTNWRYAEDLKNLVKSEFVPPKFEDIV